MAEYKRLKGAKTVLAICLAEREETYHHWRLFSHGADGVCLEFDREKLLSALARGKGVRHQLVDYELVKNVNRMEDFDVERLPFMKRWPYGDEREYRAVYVDKEMELASYSIPIDLPSITRITLSPWLAPALVGFVKEVLKSLPGCSTKKVYRSTRSTTMSGRNLPGAWFGLLRLPEARMRASLWQRQLRLPLDPCGDNRRLSGLRAGGLNDRDGRIPDACVTCDDKLSPSANGSVISV